MKIVVSTFDGAPKERRDNADKVAAMLYGTVHIGGTNTLDNFIDILESVGDDDLLYIEDDVKLCKDFLYEVNDVIDLYPNKMISFYYGRPLLIPEPQYIPYKWHIYSQCLFIPNFVVKQLLNIESVFRHKFKNNNWEMIFHELTGGYIRYYPYLVKPYNWKSTIS